MAEPTLELDGVLRDFFERNQQSGDPIGVAESIRARVAAGDPGADLPGNSAPGFGGKAGGGFGGGSPAWLPWLGLVVVAGIAGGALGLGGAFGRPTDVVNVAGSASLLVQAAAVRSCPDGPIVDRVDAGTRVLAIQRSDDSTELGIRDPSDFSNVVWIATSAVTVDSGQPDPETLPTGEPCPRVTVTSLAPSEAPTPPPVPAPKPAPGPVKPSDSTKPTIGKPTANPTQFGNTAPGVISVTATDNVGVTGVRISWSGQYSGSAAMAWTGNVWSYTFTPPDAVEGDITFSLVASDAAGNTSPTAVITVHHYYLG